MELIRSISNIIGGLDVTGSAMERMNTIYSYASNFLVKEKLKTDDQHSGADQIVPIRRSGCKKFEDLPPRLRHSHSQSCISKCSHAHHAKISSWRHSLSVHRSHVPRKLREPYIECGYFLPFMPWRYYLKALYTPSYEFANVWTHLLPALYFSYLLSKFSQEMDIIEAWPLLLITFSGIMLGTFSASAHLFHSRSSLHHSCWFVVDYFGITLYAFSSLTTNFYSGATLEYYKLFSNNYLHVTVLICFFGFTCLCLTQSNQKLISIKISRRIKVSVNGLGYAFGALPLLQRMYDNFLVGKTEISLQLHALAIIGMVAAPIIYGTDVPQCFYPGKFDVFGHSHMWFHIFTACSMLCDISAVYFDILEGPWKVISQQPNYPSFSGIAFCYCILILYGLICGCIIHLSIKHDYPEEEPFLQGELLCACGLPETMRVESANHISKSRTLASIYELAKRRKID